MVDPNRLQTTGELDRDAAISILETTAENFSVVQMEGSRQVKRLMENQNLV